MDPVTPTTLKRIALLGGSFNPPHVAHQMICLWLLSTDQTDEVWLVPCFEHPLGKSLLPFTERCAMCELAVEIFPPGKVAVCRVEEALEKPSRTLFTLQHLLRVHPEHRFSLIIGSDILREKDAWYRFEEIERLAPVLVFSRKGYPVVEGSPELPPISSGQIREALRQGQDVSRLVPAPVFNYIMAHRLYL
jgi:nicotinate-nucleotide adenylyltransferase